MGEQLVQRKKKQIIKELNSVALLEYCIVEW